MKHQQKDLMRVLHRPVESTVKTRIFTEGLLPPHCRLINYQPVINLAINFYSSMVVYSIFWIAAFYSG